MEKLIILNARNKTFGKLSNILLKFININCKFKINKYKYYIVILNMNYIKFSGLKFKNKLYYKHSNYPGGLKRFNLHNFYKVNFIKLFKNVIKNMTNKNKSILSKINKIKCYKHLTNKYNIYKPKIITNE